MLDVFLTIYPLKSSSVKADRRSVCYRTYLLAATAQDGADKLKIATCFICIIPRLDHSQKLVPLRHL